MAVRLGGRGVLDMSAYYALLLEFGFKAAESLNRQLELLPDMGFNQRMIFVNWSAPALSALTVTAA